MGLSELINDYFDTGNGTGPYFCDQDSIEFIIDGQEYFKRIYDAIKSTKGSQDAILIVGWQVDPNMDLHGFAKTDPKYEPLGKLLAERAEKGVAVRVVLNGAIFLSTIDPTPFHANYIAAAALRSWQVSGKTPLSDCVLFDYSGPTVAGSHHQKATVVKTGNNAIAFVGGMDFWPNRLDSSAHNTEKWKDGSRWGWHDAGAVVKKNAVQAVWDNFAQRWKEASTLAPRNVAELDTSMKFMLTLMNQPPFADLPAPPPSLPAINEPTQAIQVLRSRYPMKVPGKGIAWDGPATNKGGFREVFRTLSHAIKNAKKYIYMEDQFLDNSPSPDECPDAFSLFNVLAERLMRGDIKMIFVSSGKGDPGDFSAKLRTLELTEPLRQMAHQAPEWSDIAVWRMTNLTVHAKLTIIDDCFAAVGSANMHSRSMYGVDDEIHVAVVDTGNLVKELRMKVWAEHLRIGPKPWPGDVEKALGDIDTALGMWRHEWQLAPGGDMWFKSGNPAGYSPLEVEREFVGPDCRPSP